MAHNEDHPKQSGPRVFVYKASLPPFLALLLIAPVLLVAFSLAAALLVGGSVAAVLLPLLFRGKRVRNSDGNQSIELSPDQYTHIDDEVRRLPPR